MDAKEVIARRIALELKSGNLVNLGIGMPTLVANYLPAGIEVFFQAENGLIGMQPLPEAGLVDEHLADAGGSFIGAIPGACSFDSCFLVRPDSRRALDITVLGCLQVDERGLIANWTIPGKMVPGMGGADGPGDRRQARDRGDDPHGQGQAEDPEEVHAAADIGAPGQVWWSPNWR